MLDAKVLDQSQAIERAGAFSAYTTSFLMRRLLHGIEDQIESARTSVGTLHEALAHAAQAARDAAEEVARAVAEVMKEEAEPMLSRLQDVVTGP